MFLTPSAAGMDILNGAIESLIGSSNREDWTPVALNVADATVTISKDKVRYTPAITNHCLQVPLVFFTLFFPAFFVEKSNMIKKNKKVVY